MQQVYLVENSSGGYWMKAYQSLEKAKAGVEHWAAKEGRTVQWQPERFVVIARDAATNDRVHSVVPLPVHRDQDPEEQ